MTTTNTKGNVSSVLEEKEEEMNIEESPKEEVKTVKITGMVDLTFEEGKEKDLLNQVKSEYKFATRSLDAWIDKNLKRLKLYNNQKRKEEYVGEPLLFVHMNTWLASLFDDEFNKVWTPREDGDINTAENVTDVAEYDVELMEKEELDYNVDWDGLFFSYGLIDQVSFDLKKKCPAPTIIDPVSFYYDTLGSSIEGMRFLGWSLYMSEREIKDSSFMYPNAIKILKQSTGDEHSKKEEAREQRMEAIGGDMAHFDKDDMGDNNIYEVLEWRTWWQGKKVLLLLTPNGKKFIGAKILPTIDDESVSWFMSAKRFNPQPHQFKGMSLPDILEDKQRKKAVLVNDTLNLTRATVYGSYAWNSDQIKNESDLKWGYDKWIKVKGDARTAIAPVQKDAPNLPLLDTMLNYLDVSAQTASATPSLQQGVVSEQKRTLGEIEIVAQSSRTRYSLALKTFAMADRAFWGLWYLSYKVFFKKGLGKKVIRISGSTRSFRELGREDFICEVDPDIKIESKSLNEAKKMREFNQYVKILEFILLDPASDKRASLKYAMSLASMDQDEIDNQMPLTSDEVIAREQNDMIAEGVIPLFLQNENHNVHIRIHREARECKIKENHIKLHVKAIKMIQENPELDPMAGLEEGMSEGQVAPPQRPSTGAVPVQSSPLQ